MFPLFDFMPVLSFRNYHVFYYLLAGASEEERKSFHLMKPEEYHYLSQVGPSQSDTHCLFKTILRHSLAWFCLTPLVVNFCLFEFVLYYVFAIVLIYL